MYNASNTAIHSLSPIGGRRDGHEGQLYSKYYHPSHTCSLSTSIIGG